MTTRTQVMRAFGRYLDYAEHLARIKRGEIEGDRSEYARAAKHTQHVYEQKLAEFLDGEGDG